MRHDLGLPASRRAAEGLNAEMSGVGLSRAGWRHSSAPRSSVHRRPSAKPKGAIQMTDAGVNERVAVVAKLRPGSRERAGQIVAEGAPYELRETGFRRHSVYLTEDAASRMPNSCSIAAVGAPSAGRLTVRHATTRPARAGRRPNRGRHFQMLPRTRPRAQARTLRPRGPGAGR